MRLEAAAGMMCLQATLWETDLKAELLWPRVRSLGELLLAEKPSVAGPAAFLRVASGLIFVGFGQSKFTHHAKETRSFAKYGLPAPEVFSYAIGGLELVLGLVLLAGLMTRLAAPMLAGDMIGAIATAGRVEGGAINLGLAPGLLVVMLFLIWAGAGRWSLDERLRTILSARSTSEASGRVVAPPPL